MSDLIVILEFSTQQAISDEPFAVYDVPSTEYDALMELYYATNGDDWDFGQEDGIPWNFTVYTNPCIDQWEGIVCTPLQNDGYLHIQSISLEYYNLVGYLPDSFGQLTYLQAIEFTDNDLGGGPLPDSISQLQQLQSLLLAAAYISDCNPQALGSLSNLTVLDLGSNELEGPLPTELCRLVNMQSLGLDSNYFDGTMPECFGDLVQLHTFNAGTNYLTGTMPTHYSNLLQLTSFGFPVNFLTGTISTAFAALTQITEIAISNNFLNSTLPDFFSSFPDLAILSVEVNLLTGPLPESLFQLPFMMFYFISNNSFNGTISSGLCDQTMLIQIVAQSNQLSGTLPDCLEKVAFLNFLNINDNSFTGTIPHSLGQLPYMLVIQMNDNFLSGPIPSSFANLTLLHYLFANENHLSGHLPGDFVTLNSLKAFELGNNWLSGPFPNVPAQEGNILQYMELGLNLLTGSIPESMGSFPTLYALNLSDNHLTGTVSTVFSRLSSLNYLFLSVNALTGTLSEGWDTLDKLSFLYVDANYFHGPIPTSINNIVRLQSLNMSSNLFSGTIPLYVSAMTTLQVLLLQKNALTGSLTDPFSGDFENSNLTTVQVSKNQLSGSLPADVFLSPSLNVFAAVSNCFTGSLPLSICTSTSLNTLALDGLPSATSCQQKLFRGLSSILPSNLYSIGDPLTGGVPSCLFQMGNLTTLHLSGNGLTGTLPSDVTVTPSLTDLSLSHNDLHGVIPAALLNRLWKNLDLSFNRFSGELTDNMTVHFSSETSISLQQNRLSGKIPAAYRNVHTVSLLESNLFACDERNQDLPVRDPDRGKYQCGSDTLNDSMYAWIGITAALVLLVAAVWWRWRSDSTSSVKALVSRAQEWWKAGWAESTEETSALLPNLRQVFSVAQVIVRVGAISAVWCFCVLMPIYIACTLAYGTYSHQYAWTLSAAYLSGTVPFALEFTFLILLVVLAYRAFVVFSVPANRKARVVGVEQSHSHSTWYFRFGVQLLYVIVTFVLVIGVNVAYVVIALNQNGNVLTLAQIALALFKVGYNGLCSPFMMRYISHTVLKDSESREFVSIQLFVSLVNNILIPCLVVAVISPSCFYNVFHQASAVDSTFQYNGNCLLYDPNLNDLVVCTEQAQLIATTSYDPPFEYSYQCSSSFITYYAPAYVIMCILAGFAIPVVQLTMQVLHRRATPGTRWCTVLEMMLPRILKPVSTNALIAPERNVFAPYFDASQFLTTLLTYLGLLLTFGAVFPPLAVCFLATIMSITIFTRLKVGSFVFVATEENSLLHMKILNEECAGAGAYGLFRRSMFFIVTLCFLFYTLFMFDTLGDLKGADESYWVLIVVPLLSLPFVPTYFVSGGATVAHLLRTDSNLVASVEMSQVNDSELSHNVDTENPIHTVYK